MNLSHNTVLITGGTSGIGLAMAEAFLKAGSVVAVCGRREDRLRAVRDRHPALLTRVCDISVGRSRLDLADWAASDLPGLNVLVNNAGVQRDIDFTEGLGDFLSGENEIRVDLEAPIMLSGLLIPLLKANAPASIINVSSGLGFVPAARMPVYSASKAGMHAWSMAIRRQLAGSGIKVFEVAPPAVDTNLNPEGRAARGGFKAGLGPEEFVASVMEQLKADVPEIGYGMTAGFLHASRADLDRAFERMNAAWG
jgi:uncharacterized oxidoreductase